MPDKNDSESRRKLLKSIAAGTTGALIAGKTLPESWIKPVVDSVMLPAHAQTSSCSSTNTFVVTTPAQVPGDPPVVIPNGGSVGSGAELTITGSITPNPGVIGIFVEAFLDGAPSGSGSTTTDASGNYGGTLGSVPAGNTMRFISTAAAPLDCATASWTATILVN